MPRRLVPFASLPTRPVLVLAVVLVVGCGGERTINKLLNIMKTMSANTCSGEPDEVPDNEVNAHPGNPGLFHFS
jgi:hypothetical protein